MAEVAVQLLLERLGSLIVEEGKLLGGVGRDVDDIKDDLETMRSFLRDADSRGETDQRVKTWVKQVRDVAYDTEDVLDEFLLRLVRPRKQGFFDSLLHKLHYIKHLKTRHRLAAEILNIKARLKAISKRRKAFSFTDIGEGMITRANTCLCLQLIQAYNGEELCCSEVGGYKNLKRLWVAKMEGLKIMRFMKGSMPMLREFGIEICPELEMMPQGIEHLSGLQKLWLHQMPPGLVNRIRKRRPRSPQGEVQGEGEVGGEDCWKVQHIPTIKNNYRNTEGTLVIENL